MKCIYEIFVSVGKIKNKITEFNMDSENKNSF